MKAIAVNCIPESKHGHHRLQTFLEDFVSSKMKFAMVELNIDEYASPTVARGCLSIAVKRGAHPVKVMLRGKDIYLLRTDM